MIAWSYLSSAFGVGQASIRAIKEVIVIELNDEQRRLLEIGRVVDVIDPCTAQPYVLLRKELYDRIRSLLYDDSEETEDELRLHLARAAKENGWEEAGMDAYDRYDEERRQQCP